MGMRHDPASPLRTRLIARIRQEIQQGTYETPEKLDRALERLFDDLDSGTDEDSAFPDDNPAIA
jgi:hypothetical protein